jgi:hypothetical protein
MASQFFVDFIGSTLSNAASTYRGPSGGRRSRSRKAPANAAPFKPQPPIGPPPSRRPQPPIGPPPSREPQPPIGPPPFPEPPSASAPLTKKAMKNPDVNNKKNDPQAKKNDPQAKKREKQFAYNAISWTIQVLCSIVTVLGLLWTTIQFLGLSNFLGISREPPGLVYHVPDLAPQPPPPPA